MSYHECLGLVYVYAGSLHDSTHHCQGAMHILEHLHIYKSDKVTFPQFYALVNHKKALFDAIVQHDITSFMLSCSSECFDELFNMLLEMIKNPLIDHDCFACEKEVIAQEIRGKKWTHYNTLYNKYVKDLFKSEDLPVFAHGSIRDLRKIKYANIIDLNREYYSEDNMKIVRLTPGSISIKPATKPMLIREPSRQVGYVVNRSHDCSIHYLSLECTDSNYLILRFLEQLVARTNKAFCVFETIDSEVEFYPRTLVLVLLFERSLTGISSSTFLSAILRGFCPPEVIHDAVSSTITDLLECRSLRPHDHCLSMLKYLDSPCFGAEFTETLIPYLRDDGPQYQILFNSIISGSPSTEFTITLDSIAPFIDFSKNSSKHLSERLFKQNIFIACNIYNNAIMFFLHAHNPEDFSTIASELSACIKWYLHMAASELSYLNYIMVLNSTTPGLGILRIDGYGPLKSILEEYLHMRFAKYNNKMWRAMDNIKGAGSLPLLVDTRIESPFIYCIYATVERDPDPDTLKYVDAAITMTMENVKLKLGLFYEYAYRVVTHPASFEVYVEVIDHTKLKPKQVESLIDRIATELENPEIQAFLNAHMPSSEENTPYKQNDIFCVKWNITKVSRKHLD